MGIDSNKIDGLLRYMDRSTSPYHAIAESQTILDNAGFVLLEERDSWEQEKGFFYVVRDGSLIAWCQHIEQPAIDSLAIVSAHTDSPNLRLKPTLFGENFSLKQFGVEVYGGALLNTWLDRDLGVSGRLITSESDEITEYLVQINDPICRIPQLAIHLDRGVNEKGLIVNPQQHLRPIWADSNTVFDTFKDLLSENLDLQGKNIESWDLMLHDIQPARRVGADGQWLSSARIDNLVSCYASVVSLVESHETIPKDRISMACLFNHEEVGSTSAAGAAGNFLPSVIERIFDSSTPETRQRILSKSTLLSSDGAHATHPNYQEKHDLDHKVLINEGIVIKRNSNERYATNAKGQALVQVLCDKHEIPYQVFSNRSDLACGSTIGPIASANLGIQTIDIGIPQLSMHSTREICGVKDINHLESFMTCFFKS